MKLPSFLAISKTSGDATTTIALESLKPRGDEEDDGMLVVMVCHLLMKLVKTINANLSRRPQARMDRGLHPMPRQRLWLPSP